MASSRQGRSRLSHPVASTFHFPPDRLRSCPRSGTMCSSVTLPRVLVDNVKNNGAN